MQSPSSDQTPSNTLVGGTAANSLQGRTRVSDGSRLHFPLSRAVFLDRDGVINKPVLRNGRPGSPRTLEEFEIFPDVRKACALLASAGFVLVVTTNQPDLAAGLIEGKTLIEMHQLMCRMLPIRRVEVSRDPEDATNSLHQKPNAGMLFCAAEDLGIDLSRSYMVGDNWRNVECGRRAGCRTVYIDRDHGMRLPSASDMVARDLLGAARRIVMAAQTSVRESCEWQPMVSR